MLDAPPLGLGHKACIGGHFFKALGFMTRRVEDQTIQQGIEGLVICATYAPQQRNQSASAIADVTAGASAKGIPLYALDEWSDSVPPERDHYGPEIAAAVMEQAAPVYFEAESLTLAQGHSAWVPATTPLPFSAAPANCIEVDTNTASVVTALAGIWSDREGMLLISNHSQPDVSLARGDVIGVARLSDHHQYRVAGSQLEETLAADVPCPSAKSGCPDVNHVQRQEEELQRLHQVDIPPPKYYTALDAWRRKAFPNASLEVHEHCEVLEELFDV